MIASLTCCTDVVSAPQCDRSDLVAVALLVAGGVIVIILFLILAGIVLALAKRKERKDIRMDAM